MKIIWEFLSKPQNLAIVVALAGGLGFLWKEGLAPKLNPKQETSPAVSQDASASGGTAVNAAGQAQVVIDSDLASAATGGSAASIAKLPASQHAKADGGGTAINATDSARVTVKNGSKKK